MKAALVLAAAGAALAQNLSGIPACATGCLSSAISAAGCPPGDQGCQCGPTSTAIGSLAAVCLVGSCNAAQLVTAQSVGSSLCAAYSLTASPTGTTITTTITKAISSGSVVVSSSAAPSSSSAAPSSTTAVVSSSSAAAVTTSTAAMSSHCTCTGMVTTTATTTSGGVAVISPVVTVTTTTATTTTTTSKPPTVPSNAAERIVGDGRIGAMAAVVAAALVL